MDKNTAAVGRTIAVTHQLHNVNLFCCDISADRMFKVRAIWEEGRGEVSGRVPSGAQGGEGYQATAPPRRLSCKSLGPYASNCTRPHT